MTVVNIGTDEMYPVMYISDSTWGIDCDVPQALLDEYNAVDLYWHQLQNKLNDYYEAGKKAKVLEESKSGRQPKGWEVY